MMAVNERASNVFVVLRDAGVSGFSSPAMRSSSSFSFVGRSPTTFSRLLKNRRHRGKRDRILDGDKPLAA